MWHFSNVAAWKEIEHNFFICTITKAQMLDFIYFQPWIVLCHPEKKI